MKIHPALILLAALAAGCATGPVTVPDDITAGELVQRAQEASGKYKYRQALEYYELVLVRFPYNIDMVCAAEYEIAFIHYKQKKYDTARTEFTDLLRRYEGSDAELLPPQFKRLSEMVLETIAKRTAPRNPPPLAEGSPAASGMEDPVPEAAPTGAE